MVGDAAQATTVAARAAGDQSGRSNKSLQTLATGPVCSLGTVVQKDTGNGYKPSTARGANHSAGQGHPTGHLDWRAVEVLRRLTSRLPLMNNLSSSSPFPFCFHSCHVPVALVLLLALSGLQQESCFRARQTNRGPREDIKKMQGAEAWRGRMQRSIQIKLVINL